MIPDLKKSIVKCERANPSIKITLFVGTLTEYIASSMGRDLIGKFDVVAALLVLCSVPDPVASSVKECESMLKKPGGKFIYVEHVQGRNSMHRFAQKAYQPIWNLLGDGCQLCRDTQSAISAQFAPTKGWANVQSTEGYMMAGAFPIICGVCEAKA